MERINVSEYFRFSESNCHFNMEFSSRVDMRKAYEAMEAAVMAIANEEGYYKLWLQDLGDCCDADKFEIMSTLMIAEFADYVPAMCKAVAEAIPMVDFTANAWYNDLRCYCVDGFEISFKGRHLTMTETFEDEVKEKLQETHLLLAAFSFISWLKRLSFLPLSGSVCPQWIPNNAV